MRLHLLAITAFLSAQLASAATYYIDYSAGDDTHAGTTSAQSWKHCPGDAGAKGSAASAKLAAGDLVIFKGGVEYPGELDLQFSGAPGKPIIFDGNNAGTFGEGRAIFTGASALTGFKKCSSADEAGGAPDWKHCWFLDLPKPIDPLAVNLFYANSKRGVVARTPNAADPMWWQDRAALAPAADADISPTSLKLQSPLAANEWQGAYAGLWSIRNWIEIRPIKSTNPDGTITFDEYRPRKKANLFMLLNHPRLIDQPGEYAVINEGKRLLIDLGDTDPKVTISTRRYGLNLNDQSHCTIRHITFRNFAGALTDKHAGGGIVSWLKQDPAPGEEHSAQISSGPHASFIVVEDCESLFNQSLAKVAGLQFTGVENLRVEKCKVAENQGSPGIYMGDCVDAIARGNELVRNGGTGFRVFGCRNVVVEGNRVLDHLGMHANGISVYLNSDNVKVHHNFVSGGNMPLTLEWAHNVSIDYNILRTTQPLNPGLAIWTPLEKTYGSCTDITIRNNLIFGDYGLKKQDLQMTGLVVQNNIITGSDVDADGATMANNLYLGLTPTQSARGWKFEPGAKQLPADAKIFADAEKLDFHPAADSPAIDAGITWGQTNDFFSQPIKGTPDIGPCEKQ